MSNSKAYYSTDDFSDLKPGDLIYSDCSFDSFIISRNYRPKESNAEILFHVLEIHVKDEFRTDFSFLVLKHHDVSFIGGVYDSTISSLKGSNYSFRLIPCNN